MPRLQYINTHPATKIDLPSLTPKMKDPIRFPAVVEPLEKEFEDGYKEMLDVMQKMISVELMKQIKEV